MGQDLVLLGLTESVKCNLPKGIYRSLQTETFSKPKVLLKFNKTSPTYLKDGIKATAFPEVVIRFWYFKGYSKQ